MNHFYFNAAAFGAVMCAGLSGAAAALNTTYENFHYRGTVSRYASLADAQSGTGALSTTVISTVTNGPRSTLADARDGVFSIQDAVPPSHNASNQAYVSTSWYFTTTPNSGNGYGNPNNTNNGFIQYYDLTANPLITGGWSAGYTTFSVSLSGGNGDSSNAARLWDAPTVSGPASDTGGIFHEFDLEFTADFALPASLNPTSDWYETSSEPVSLSGGFTGIFENQSTSNPARNGFYTFDLTLGQSSWAMQQGATTQEGAAPSAFFAAPAVPEPGLPLLLGLAVLPLTAGRRRVKPGSA